MNRKLQWMFGLMGVLLIGVTPYLWNINPDLLWITVPLLCLWAVWLILEYLNWAKRLGKK